MIVTLTPNPSLDRTFDIGQLAPGEVLRASTCRVEPGGKGINVARALHEHGHEVRAVLPCGGWEGTQLVRLLEAAGVRPATVPISGQVRSNVSIVESDGTVTKLNEPGPRLTDAEASALLDEVSELGAAAWVVGSGSLPPGASANLFAELIQRSRRHGSKVAIDSSGPALDAAILAGPDIIKPNLLELQEVTGLAIRTLGEAVLASRRIHERGVAAVLTSLGRHGAILVDADGTLHAQAPVDAPGSSVGAGDALLAGYLSTGPTNRQDAIREAVAFGTAAAALPGSQMPSPAGVAQVSVKVTPEPDPTIHLDAGDASARATMPRPF